MLDPIIITGPARSRTSMITQILELCGLFLGDVIQETKANPQRQLENHHIIKHVQKPHLKRYGFDPKGQNPLPPIEWHEPDPARRDMVLNIMKNQGLKPGMKWGFKDTKPCLDWRTWHDAFPNAYWIVTERKDTDVINSCMKTSFMSKYKDKKGWQKYIDDHKVRIKDMFNNLERIYKLNTDDVMFFKFNKLEQIIKEINLNWNYDKIKAQVKPIDHGESR
jgi:hypothetical protein